MNPFSIVKVVFASLLTILFSWIVPHKVAVSTHNNISPFPTITLSPFVSITPSAGQPDASFLYPGAIVTDNPDGSKTLTSADDPNQITQWYKDQIFAAGMHSTSVSQTNSNNNILNVLDASSNAEEVKVTIMRPAGEQNTTITVRVSSK